jgi:hypothetical protein
VDEVVVTVTIRIVGAYPAAEKRTSYVPGGTKR